MSIALVVTAGYGNSTLSGAISFVVTRGYNIDDEIIVIPEVTPTRLGKQISRSASSRSISRSGSARGISRSARSRGIGGSK